MSEQRQKGDLRIMAETAVRIMRPFVDVRFDDALREIVEMHLQKAYEQGLRDGEPPALDDVPGLDDLFLKDPPEDDEDYVIELIVEGEI